MNVPNQSNGALAARPGASVQQQKEEVVNALINEENSAHIDSTNSTSRTNGDDLGDLSTTMRSSGKNTLGGRLMQSFALTTNENKGEGGDKDDRQKDLWSSTDYDTFDLDNFLANIDPQN